MNGSIDFTHLKKADFEPSSSANLAFENSKDVLTWRAPKANGANVGENLKPNGTNEAQNGTNSTTPHKGETNSRVANEGADGAHSEANLGKRGGTSTHANLDENSANSRTNPANQGANEINSNRVNLDANEANLRSTREANSNEANLPNASSANTTKAPKVKLTKEQNEVQKFLKQILKAPKDAKKAFSISAGEKQTWKDAINEKLKELNKKEQILNTNKEQPSAILGANGTNSNSTNLDATEANLHSTREANSNEANLSATNASSPSAYTTKAPRVKLTKEQIEAQTRQIYLTQMRQI